MRDGKVGLMARRERVVSETYRRIWAVARRIPKGKVATYGQIAAISGHPGQARLVGYAIHALPEGSDVPWHRVINARGEISFDEASPGYHVQRALLEKDGVRFDVKRRIDLKVYRWNPA